MTKEEERTMYLHVLQKWEWVAQNWIYTDDEEKNEERLLKDLPHLKAYTANCSFCHNYFGYDCEGCPLNIDGIICMSDVALFSIWINGAHNRINAQEEAENLRDKINELCVAAGYDFTEEEVDVL